MKAKELAALLLQNPEDEVYFEYLTGSDNFYYYQTMNVGGIERTPDGVFMNYNHVTDRTVEVRSPSHKPEVQTARIKLNDEENPWFNVNEGWGESDDLQSGYFWISLIDDQYYKTWWYGERVSIFSLIEDQDDCPEVDDYEYYYTPANVEYVEVLTSIHPDTWEETWERMTFEEAYEHFNSMYNNSNSDA